MTTSHLTLQELAKMIDHSLLQPTMTAIIASDPSTARPGDRDGSIMQTSGLPPSSPRLWWDGMAPKT